MTTAVDKCVNLSGKRVLVLGLGRFGGGVGVSRFLCARGAQVTVTDQADAASLAESVGRLDGLDIRLHLGGHRREDFEGADLVVVNPAVSRHSPWFELIRELGISYTSEMNLFFQRCAAPIVGVTGSNGKSTTAAMIAHVLRETADTRVWLGGNIGQANLLEEVECIAAEDTVVLELSSFQLCDLEEIRRSPQVAVVTNLTPNHLDWHRTLEHYIHSKQNIVRFQGAGNFVVLNGDDPALKGWEKETAAQVHTFGAADMEGVALAVPGQHNRANAAAALKAAALLGRDRDAVAAALGRFAGLEHRLERVGEVNGVRYYNDSIATTPESAIAAIAAFAEDKILIMGGYDKKIPFDDLVRTVIEDPTVTGVILLGQVRTVLKESIRSYAGQQGIEKGLAAGFCQLADSLEQAVELTRQSARSGSVVLLSPACASYDMYRNFKERGEHFRRLVLIN